MFLLMPVGGLFTGYFQEHPVTAAFQTVAYVFVFVDLRRLADARERRGANAPAGDRSGGSPRRRLAQ
jgi:hypothetical protein